MAEEIAVENGRISNFEVLITLTLTLTFDRGHTAFIPSYITHRPLPACQISLKSKELFFRRTDVCTYRHTYARTDGHLRPALLGRLYQRVDLKMGHVNLTMAHLGPIIHLKART